MFRAVMECQSSPSSADECRQQLQAKAIDMLLIDASCNTGHSHAGHTCFH